MGIDQRLEERIDDGSELTFEAVVGVVPDGGIGGWSHRSIARTLSASVPLYALLTP